MRLVFKGGGVVDADVTSFQTASDLAGEITSLTWKTPENPQVKLVDINVGDLSAVFSVFGEGEVPA
jgi:hypothetical protein